MESSRDTFVDVAVVSSGVCLRCCCVVDDNDYDDVSSPTIEQAIVRHVDFQQIKCLLLGSPGFVKDDFFEFLNLEAVRREERVRRGDER